MTTPPLSPEFLRAFAARADANGRMRFDTFVDLALYDETIGYYRQRRQRVGYGEGSDFFTASTSGPVFGELVSAACVALLGDRKPEEHTFVEIGAENEGGILLGIDQPFGQTRTIQLGETVDLAGKCVVFSNELFDAQPFRRFRFSGGKWRELGVEATRDGLVETLLPTLESIPEWFTFPTRAPEGYTIDAPFAATALAEIMARQPWTGLFVVFDYGKTWQEIAEATPAGTARAYYRHTQHNELLARPGDQDLTCHVCWDWLDAALRRNGFAAPTVQTQEAFFIHHAERYIAPAIAADAAQLTPRKRSLMQLLHGAHLGQKFQVLHALR